MRKPYKCNPFEKTLSRFGFQWNTTHHAIAVPDLVEVRIENSKS